MSLQVEFAEVLKAVRRPGDFYVSRTVELPVLSLEVDGVGPIALPLLPVQGAALVAAAEAAPYGRGEATFVDPTVRRSWQIAPERVHWRGKHWAGTLDKIVATAAAGLGVDQPVEARFYKLLVYDEGSFFVSHRDTEKAPGMFATLVVVLPSNSEGGELVVRHHGREVRLALRPDERGDAAFAAFYADCVHEVQPLTAGYRLALIFNLVRRGRGKAPQAPHYEGERASLVRLMQRWRDDIGDENTPEKLVYPLAHAYTPAELGFAALKGADAAAAGVLAGAAEEASFDLHLALLTIEESGSAEYSGYGEDDFVVSEVADTDRMLSDWRRPDGGSPAIGPIPMEEIEASPRDALDELEPDDSHFHEATGNEGASFERSYRRAALVVWPRERRFAVLCQAGIDVTLPYLDALAKCGTEAATPERERLWGEANELAGHMIAHWPRDRRGETSGKGRSAAARMLGLLSDLKAPERIEAFLTTIGSADGYAVNDTGAMLAALALLAPERQGEIVAAIGSHVTPGTFWAYAALLNGATARGIGISGFAVAASSLCKAVPGADTRNQFGQRPTIEPPAVVEAMTALAAVDPALADRAATRILGAPRTYKMDEVLVPAVRELVSKGGASSAEAVELLRQAVLTYLSARIAEPLEPPKDWRRPAKIEGKGEAFDELTRFLADPARQSWIYKAAQAERSRIEEAVRNAHADVDWRTERRGNPHSLILTKNQRSYERRAKQRADDLENLAALQAHAPPQAGD